MALTQHERYLRWKEKNKGRKGSCVCGNPLNPANKEYCSIQCLGKSQRGKKKPQLKGNQHNYKTGIMAYRKYKKRQCERCLSDKYLLVHHKDRNRLNNDILNLETLCKSCHQKEHNSIKNFGKSLMRIPKGLKVPKYVYK